jgi:hypothetical protein
MSGRANHTPPARLRAPALILLRLLGVGLLGWGAHGALTRWGAWDYVPLEVVIPAALLYLASHALRALRLTVIIADEDASLRDVARVHAWTAGVSILLPFKLGELFRVVELARLVRGDTPHEPMTPFDRFAGAALLVWTERVLDAMAIAAMLLLAILGGSQLLQRFALPGVAVVLVGVGTFAVYYLLPETIESVKLFVLRRYNTPAGAHALRTLEGVSRILDRAPGVVRRRFPALAMLTGLIWALEVAAMCLFLPAGRSLLRGLETAVAFLFSNLLPGGPRTLEAIAREQGTGDSFDAPAQAAAGLYPQAVYLPLLLLALLAGVLTLLHGLARRRSPRAHHPAWRAPA